MQNHKIVLCGDTFVGKSAIFTSIQHGGEVRHEQLQSTISGTFAQIKVPKDPQNGETQVKLQLWDTAGDERLRHITRNYFNGASGAVIVYDVTSRDSMQVANEWLASVRENAPQHCYVTLVGNKTDLLESVEVPYREGKQFAEDNGFPAFMETSAKDGTGIQELFKHVAQEVSARHVPEPVMQGRQSTKSITLSSQDHARRQETA